VTRTPRRDGSARWYEYRPAHWPKYPPIAGEHESDSDNSGSCSPELSESDARTIARMIRKYGREVVIVAVGQIPPSGKRGRPSLGMLTYYEAMHLAQWFEEATDEYRSAGSRKPIRDAEIELYQMIVEEQQQRQSGYFERWRLNIKKKRLLGSHYLSELREADRRREKHFQRGRKKGRE
jgi:hypothetical protein